MPSFQTKQRVKHAAADMFALVADVEAYPRFVPLCEALSVRARDVRPDGIMVLVADMTVSYKVFRETFTSRVTLLAEQNTILVEYLDGPFRQMENRWTFEPVADRVCDVGFYIAYEFKSRTLGALMGAVFDRAFRKFASAFETRADQVYGAA